jgi:hypothetical protein
MPDVRIMLRLLRHITIFALNLIEVCAEDVVRQILARHILHHIFPVYDFSLFVQVSPTLRRHSHLPPSSIISLEERQSVAASRDAGALVVKQW